VPYAQISDNLKRAVIASEDGDFINHDGVEWEAIEKAWQKNAKAEELAAKRTQKSAQTRQARARCQGPQDRRRLHHHPAAGQEPAAVWRAHAAAQGRRNSC
jgi:membrane carboxypeptidase/penicillin-binding protein PbpC